MRLDSHFLQSGFYYINTAWSSNKYECLKHIYMSRTRNVQDGSHLCLPYKGVCLWHQHVFQVVCQTSPVIPLWTAPSWWRTTSSKSSSWSTTWWQARTSTSHPHNGSFEPFPCSSSTDNMPCHFTAAFAAGFCTTLVASPVDVVKTRYMNSVPGHYTGALHCALNMLLNEGPTSFYKGYIPWGKNNWHLTFSSFVWLYLFIYYVCCRFVPSYLRLGSWNIVMFVTYEQFQRAVMALRRWQLPPVVFKTV